MTSLLRIAFVVWLVLGAAPRATAQIEPFIGQLIAVGFTFCPQGWTEAGGQTLSIAQNSALFSLLGTTYGGDGETTFRLPDLRGRVPIAEGQGPGLTQRDLGEQGGVESVTLTQAEMPAHNHTHAASTQSANTANPAAALPARKTRTPLYRGGSAPDTSMDQAAISVAGGSQPHENMQPFLAVRWCIALEGIFPSRP